MSIFENLKLPLFNFASGLIALALVGFGELPSAHSATVEKLLGGDAFKWNKQIIDIGPLKKFYKKRRSRGIWTTKTGLNKFGHELLEVVKRAPMDGLVSSDYIARIPKNLDKMSEADTRAMELLLSQALWKFGRDLSAGRTTPAVSEPDIVISRKKTDISGWLNLAARRGPTKVIDALRPTHQQYALLRKLLAKTKAGSKKARKIIVNMERWRWLPRSLGKRHVLVNQAAFEVYIREKGKIVDRRRVVIGKTFHKTPMFSHVIKYSEFNPTWTVSRNIAGNELLPKLRRDPGYLEKRNYKLYTSWEKDAPAMSAHSVNWQSVNAKKFPYRIVQQPGDNNALGSVKFIFPNRFNVYLHDTQSKKLFSKSSRAFSHGCIRVEKPLDFAAKLYAAERTLNAKKIAKLVASKETKRVKFRKPIPVHLTYFTVWIDEKGKAHFHKDVYKRDVLVGKLLFGRA